MKLIASGRTAQVRGNLRLGEPENSLARVVLGGPIEDPERVCLPCEFAVELQRDERPCDERRMQFANLPRDVRVGVDPKGPAVEP